MVSPGVFIIKYVRMTYNNKPRPDFGLDVTELPVTEASLRNAAVTLKMLTSHMPRKTELNRERFGQAHGMAVYLEGLADEMGEERKPEPEKKIIPIPPDALSADSMEMILKHLYGISDNE